jgi:predicted secreted protein
MASHIGRDGIVKVGANTVAEVKSFSIEESADTVETTKMTDTARSHAITLTSFSGSLDCFWDETDTTGQGALTIGASVTLALYPEGDTTGDTFYSGTALVTGVSRSASFDGMVEASISVQGTGALTADTVPA